VRKNLIFTNKELSFLQELVRQKVSFLIVGLSAATLQGASVATPDIDIWFKNIAEPGIGKALRKTGGTMVPSIGLNPPMFAGDGLQLFDIVMTMHGLESFDREYRRSIEIPLGKFKIRILPLERIIKSKKAVKRPKDRLVLPVLEDTLIAIRTRRGRRE
jgi:hypothetical protein